eukprot:631017-Lingulodinium_polyedra.AAC.1
MWFVAVSITASISSTNSLLAVSILAAFNNTLRKPRRQMLRPTTALSLSWAFWAKTSGDND